MKMKNNKNFLYLWVFSIIFIQINMKFTASDFSNYLDIINALISLSLTILTILSGFLGLVVAFDKIDFFKDFKDLKILNTDLKFIRRLSRTIVSVLLFIILLIGNLFVSVSDSSISSIILITLVLIIFGILFFQCVQIFRLFSKILDLYVKKESEKRIK